VVLVHALYPVHALEGHGTSTGGSVKYIDWASDVPGYGSAIIDWNERLKEVESAIDNSPRSLRTWYHSFF